LKKFLNSPNDDIFHPLFLAQMVLSPLNSIVDDVLIPQIKKEENYEWTATFRNKKAKLHVLFRYDILCRMLAILQEHGTKPPFHKNQKSITKLIESPSFGNQATSSGYQRSMFVTGFTAAFFLTLPELFIQWVQQKDGDGSKEHTYKILEFLGQ
jgi:hypothetical protein